MNRHLTAVRCADLGNHCEEGHDRAGKRAQWTGQRDADFGHNTYVGSSGRRGGSTRERSRAVTGSPELLSIVALALLCAHC
jgi:hypothetical protein